MRFIVQGGVFKKINTSLRIANRGRSCCKEFEVHIGFLKLVRDFPVIHESDDLFCLNKLWLSAQ